MYSDSAGIHDTGFSIGEAMECSPFQTQYACMPPVIGTNPGSNGDCSEGPFQVHAQPPTYIAYSSGGMNWGGFNTSFLHQTGYCNQGDTCEYDNFSISFPGQQVTEPTGTAICN
ncbi:MAG: hypothetical protein ACRD1L_02730 [Terriglobales bacterium]